MRIGLLLLGLGIGAATLEIGLRVLFPNSLMGAATQLQFAAGGQKHFQPDPECGYIPVLDNSVYDRYGCRLDNGRQLDSYDGEDRKGRRRVLFVGDSVTRRERTMRALQALYGDKLYEYWNAGVESFNVEQELIFYRRVNRKLKPDQVILTFHNNDFQETPLVYRKNGQLEVLFLRKDRAQINPWWFNHSYLYRWLTGINLGRLDRDRRSQAMREALRGWQQQMAQDKADFAVILLPILKPVKEWSSREVWSRETALELLQEQKILYFDLLPDMEKALQEGLNLQESPDDSWHPSPAAAAHFARYLWDQGLLTGPEKSAP
jgi:lysophospholipase L1-like esterase